MSPAILVAFASKHGATAEIAAHVAQTLRDAGHEVDLAPVADVADLAPYHAVVLGSAVYAGHWRKEAAHFLKEHASELRLRPLWIFSSGPTGEGDPVELLQGWHAPENLQKELAAMGARDIAVFHGVLDPETLNFAERLIVKSVKAPLGDFRDWDAIAAWARQIHAGLAM